MEKKCFKCGEVKDLANFYKHKQMADGHVNKCKDCNKKDVRENRKLKIDYYRKYDRERGNRQDKYYLSWYRKTYPKKYAAHKIVGNAIKDGKMKRQSECESCGSGFSVHAHHDDYNYPLTVRWLCAACHKAWHDKHGEALNGD